MCKGIFGSSSPKVEQVTAATTTEEKESETEEAVAAARDEQKRLARLSANNSGTILTSALGLTTDATVQKKTLLGQ